MLFNGTLNIITKRHQCKCEIQHTTGYRLAFLLVVLLYLLISKQYKNIFQRFLRAIRDTFGTVKGSKQKSV